MYYDQDGIMKAAGAEAESAAIVAIAEDEGWTKAELYVYALLLMHFTLLSFSLATLPSEAHYEIPILGSSFDCARRR